MNYNFHESMDAPVHRMLNALEPNTVIYEVKQGPFAPLGAENLAAWAPNLTDEVAIATYIERMSENK